MVLREAEPKQGEQQDQMANERVRIAIELARRGVSVQLSDDELASATNEQLEQLFGAVPMAVGAEQSALRPSGVGALGGGAPIGGGVSPAPMGRMASSVRRRTLSIGAAVLQACSAQALDAAEIVEAVQRLRPGTNPPSVYPEIKRCADRGDLVRMGRAEPYTYRTAPQAR